MGRIDYKEIYALSRQIVQCLESIFLGFIQGTNTSGSKLRARARTLMNAPGTLPFFIFVYLTV